MPKLQWPATNHKKCRRCLDSIVLTAQVRSGYQPDLHRSTRSFQSVSARLRVEADREKRTSFLINVNQRLSFEYSPEDRPPIIRSQSEEVRTTFQIPSSRRMSKCIRSSDSSRAFRSWPLRCISSAVVTHHEVCQLKPNLRMQTATARSPGVS